MGDNKIRSTSDKIVGSPSDRTREVKSQESTENGSKSLIEKVRQYIGPASAGNLLKTAFILALTGGAEARLEPFGSVPGLVGSDSVAALPPAPYDQRVRFTSDYVPTPQNYKAFQQLEKQLQNPPFYLNPPPDVQAPSSGETSQSTLETHPREQDENKWREPLTSNEKKIATLRSLMDKLNEVRERSLLESDSKIPDARTLLSDEKSACHDPCSDIPASVNCIKECTTDEISGFKTDPTCLDVSTSGVSARIEPISSPQGSSDQQVFLNYNDNLRVQNNCPRPISNIGFQIDIKYCVSIWHHWHHR